MINKKRIILTASIMLLLLIGLTVLAYYQFYHVNLITAYPAINPDGTFNAVIEIPAGTQAKWEASKKNGRLELETRNGKPRIINYLAYPFNYGFIPRTLLPKSMGGDGDPLDVIVLGNTIKQGSVVEVHVIGVLNLLDKNEIDDKLIAVPNEGVMSHVRTLQQLKKEYPGITKIVKIWFAHYKKKGKIEIKGLSNEQDAKQIALQAAGYFEGLAS